MPEAACNQELSAEQFACILSSARQEGYSRVKFSSEWGEPLMRKDIEQMVASARDLGYEDISLGTNGKHLLGRARGLRDAGLHRVCISLDTLKPSVYQQITGQDVFNQVRAAVEECAVVFDKAV